MKLPNVSSLIALCLVLIPAVQVGIEQVYPAADWYWSPVIVTILGSIAKFLQTKLSVEPSPPAPPEGVSFSPSSQPPAVPTWRKVMLG